MVYGRKSTHVVKFDVLVHERRRSGREATLVGSYAPHYLALSSQRLFSNRSRNRLDKRLARSEALPVSVSGLFEPGHERLPCLDGEGDCSAVAVGGVADEDHAVLADFDALPAVAAAV